MSFDHKAYLADVLKPLARDKGQLADIQRAVRELQESPGMKPVAGLDLARLLAVPGDGSDLTAHLAAVVMYLNQRQSMTAAQMLKKLVAELKTADQDLTSPAFWTKLAAAKSDAFKEKVAEFGAAVSLEHQALKVITKEQLEEKAKAQGLVGAVSEQTLVSAVESAGIAVRPDFQLPQLAVPRVVADLAKHAEYRSIVDVLLLADNTPPATIRVIDNLRYGSGGGSPITNQQLEAAQRAAASGRDSDALQAAQKVLTLIRADFVDPPALHQLVLAVFVNTTKEMLARGELLASALGKLVKGTGLDEVEAARLLAKLSGSASTRSLGDVTDLLAEGALADARRTFDAVADVEQFGEAEVKRVGGLLASAEQRKASLFVEYESAMKAGDHGAAAYALGHAASVDKHDARLQDLLEKLPPPSVEHLVAKPLAEGGISLSWTYDGGSESRFIVVRSRDGKAPANTGDGTQLVRDSAAASYVDTTPPVAQRLGYSVFAVRRGVSSLPTSVSQMLLPAPTDVSASTALTEVTLMWRLPAEAVGIEVTQIEPDGTRKQIDARGASRATVTGLVTGDRYRFTLASIYVLADGTRTLSPPVSVDASPRGAITAVRDLRVGEGNMPDGRSGHRGSWTEPGGYPVELWSFPIDEQIPPPGTEVDLADFDEVDGRRVNGVLSTSAGRTELSFAQLRELRVVTAITVGGARGMIGDSVIVGSAPSVKNPKVDRYGGELVVSWEWPHGDYSASVSWFENASAQTRKFSRAEYKINGGFRIPSGGAVDRVTIATVAFGNDREWIASPVEVRLSAELPVVRYEVDIPPSRFGRRKPARVSVRSETYAGSLPLLVVARESSIMPSRPDDGEVLERLMVDLDGVNPANVEFTLPRLQSPFWIRIFPGGETGVKLEDPPTQQLKG